MYMLKIRAYQRPETQIHHGLMIAKLGAYGFSEDALQYMRNYLQI